MEEIKKVKDKVYVFFQLLSLVQWLIAIIFSSGTTIAVVILMPTINLLVTVLLGLGILIFAAFFMLAANILILKKREIALKEQEIAQKRDIEEQRRKDERELPKIEVLNAKNSATSIELHVKNVGAEGKVTAFVENNSKFMVRWFELTEAIKGAVAEKEKKLARGGECRVDISRKKVTVTGGKTITDWGAHLIKVHFPETDQIFKCKFRITDEGIKDFEFLGEEDE